MRGAGSQAAGRVETWAARAWNVLNEGRPFAVVYPPMVVAAGALLGVGPRGAVGAGLLAGLVLSLVWAAYAFPLRWRALLWLGLPAGLVALDARGALGLIAVGFAGYALFTVVIWGGVYYRLRTRAPRTNALRFWRLVATNSDPTSGNAAEQVPKLLLTLAAVALVAREPSAGSWARVALVAAGAAALGALAWRGFARTRLVRYPAPARRPAAARSALARRVYVIVIDGCNRERLRQAAALGRTPTLDRLAREGSEYLAVDPAYPARTVVCFSSMLTGTTPAEHGMRSNFAPRLGVRRESIFDVLAAAGRRGRLVGIAHLLDPFGEEVVRTVTSVQPTARIDASLIAAAREVVEREDPDLLVLQLLGADQIGHVRGTRNPEYLDELARADARLGEFLAWLDVRGRLEGATVVVMADHGQGRGIGGHGHLDWGERPVPFVVHGAGAVPGAVVARPASVLELAVTLADLLGVRAPAGARGRALVPARDPDRRAAAPAPGSRALAIIPARDEAPRIAAVIAGLPAAVEGVPLDVLVVDDGSADATAAVARAAGARVLAHPAPRGLGAALRTGLAHARDAGYAAAVTIDGDGEYDPRQVSRVLLPVLTGRADHVLGSRFLGERVGMRGHRALANRLASAIVGALLGGRVVTDAQTGVRALSRRALAAVEIAHDYNAAQVLTLALWGAGIDLLEVPIDYRRRAHGRSFVRYPEYARRVLPAVWRAWRRALRTRRASAAATASVTPVAHAEPAPYRGSSPSSGPQGAVVPGAIQPVPASRSSA